MIIPEVVRVGSAFYGVKTQATPIVINGVQCLGYCDSYKHTIMLDLTMQDDQTLEQTFCHELVHAMLAERDINLEAMGLTNHQMEKVVDNLGLALHQVLLDNPDIALSPEEYDAKYPPEQEEQVYKEPQVQKLPSKHTRKIGF